MTVPEKERLFGAKLTAVINPETGKMMRRTKRKHKSSTVNNFTKLDSEEKYKCNKCDFIITVEEEIDPQYGKINDPLTCAQASMRYHFRKYHSGENCMCTGCGKAYPLDHERKKCEMRHNNVRNYKCPVEGCGKAFFNKGVLKNHIRVHTGEKPFHCDFCPSKFRQKQQLTTHLRVHTGDMPYLCNQKFKYLASRNSHPCI